ncbi:MAG: hypothetical protein DWQ31_07390 [Planctomycetota bacterium]|nr:MAG: hypothetical protein DWQ31_07390 [Planctomycetota bacterium]
MPATEQTWRNLKGLHVVFGVSASVLLVATLWLLAADHNREYKVYQRQFERIEAARREAQIAEFETVTFEETERRLHMASVRAKYTAPDENLVKRFVVQMLSADWAAATTGPEGQTTDADAAKLASDLTELKSLGLGELDKHEELLDSVLARLREAVPDPTAEAIMESSTRLQEMAAELPPPELALDRGLADEDEEQLDSLAKFDDFADEAAALFGLMRSEIARVQFVQDQETKKRKARLAQLDEAKSKLDLAVRDAEPAEELAVLKKNFDEIRYGKGPDDRNSVAALTRSVQAATLQREALDSIVRAMTDAQARAAKDLADHEAARRTLVEGRKSGLRGLVTLPIIDAFGGFEKPRQVWLPELKIPVGSFGQVARFDRCVSCHLAIDKTAPGTADQPAYPHRETLTYLLRAPAEKPETQTDEDGEAIPLSTRELYGFVLAESGWLNPADVTIEVVLPGGAGARAGLKMGDVITHVDVGGRLESIVSRADAQRYLVQQAPWGEAIRVVVARGMPHPYSSHPRLDLFVGSLSPHKIEEMGCTICHEGQGSATEFKWVSHTPNNPEQAHEWARDHGYFNNHHWIFPMRPQRFVESSCLKCHHEVEQLLPSERFPEHPAPKLYEGYDLVRNLGCYGCHEINGYDGPDRRIGPDLRNEPAYFAAAAQLRFEVASRKRLFVAALTGASAEAQPIYRQSLDLVTEIETLATQVAYHPEDEAARTRLHFLITQDAERASAPAKLLEDPGLRGQMRVVAQRLKTAPMSVPLADRLELVESLRADQAGESPQLRPDAAGLADLLAQPPVLAASSHKLAELPKTVESPGRLRRVGPSLRHVDSKLDTDTLYRWIYNPRSIRPSTKMPRFFGQYEDYDYLTEPSQEKSERFEFIEAYSAAVYLRDKSQPFDYLPVQPGVTEPPDFDRGRTMFQTKGCVACHQHQEDPEDADTLVGTSEQGPNLTNLGEKLRAEKSKKWLHSWLLGPNHYSLRTLMPNVLLEPEPVLDGEGKPEEQNGQVRKYDPAADIVFYLLGEDWEPQASELAPLTAEQQTDLDELAYEYLASAFPEVRAKDYLAKGVPPKVASKLVGYEVELAIERPDETDDAAVAAHGEAHMRNKLNYVGRRTIGKLGCTGCHDIPGFEAAKPIGAALADWGRKESSKLAFEHIVEYLGGQQAKLFGTHKGHGKTAAGDDHGEHAHEHIDPYKWEQGGRDQGYFIEALHHHQREAFLWQKLREPRSYDYHKTDTKDYNERLRMPQFWGKSQLREHRPKEHTEEDRQEMEAVMTFVLGLVAEPPAEKYIHQPDERLAAIVEGEKVLARYNCAGCHSMTLDQWQLSFDPAESEFEPAAAEPDYPFLKPFFTPDEIEASLRTDPAGRRQATLHGMPRLSDGGLPAKYIFLAEDEEFVPVSELDEEEIEELVQAGAEKAIEIELWRPTLINGQVFDVKAPLPTISERLIVGHHRGRGGDFATYLIPLALELANKQTGAEARAWVPPPLIDQGNKTQSEWLHDFLLDPHPIRPAVILRMPKFNMSSDEATSLVRYFAARDNADYPHQFNHRTRPDYLDRREHEYQERLSELGLTGTRFDDAFQIIVNKEGCVKCHLVGDYDPGGDRLAQAPNLADVNRRLQASYLKPWLAKPTSVLPYTLMPVNFRYGSDGYVVQNPTTGETEQLYHGDSTEQIEAVVDLLMNLDTYLESQISIENEVRGDRAARN